MDNNKNPSIPDDDGWFDDLLTTPSQESDIGPDEDAISGLQLPEISDMELEKILKEALSENWPEEAPMEEDSPILDQEYRDAEEDALDGYEDNSWEESYPGDQSQGIYPEEEFTDEDSEEALDKIGRAHV